MKTPESVSRLAGFLAGPEKEHEAAREIGRLLGLQTLQDVPDLKHAAEIGEFD